MALDNTARKSIPGRDANLPTYIVERMELLGARPSLRQLAVGTGVPLVTLQQNLRGATEMRLSTAKKIAAFLEVSLNDLVNNADLG